MNEGN
ncbi:hypothetical protein L345_12295 [Ophiophagus hannah]